MFEFIIIRCFIGITNALDEGSFLWAERRGDNLSNDKGSVVKPGRWTRSVFNWLHSPLINSIQEAFVADSIYENSPPATKCVKRSITKNTSAVNLEGSFENEFFLWEDNEGNPLEFGLKQIQDLRPCSQPIQHNYRRFNRGQTDDLWEEPLVYEYNQDVKDVDTKHLSYHEKFKLNDILGNKLHNPFHHIFSFKHTTKHPSIYYTLSLSGSPNITSSTLSSTEFTDDSLPATNFSNQQSSQNLTDKFNISQTTLSCDGIHNEHSSAAEVSTNDTFENYDADESKNESTTCLLPSVQDENNFISTTTLACTSSKNLSSNETEKFILGDSKGDFAPLKPWLNFHQINLAGEETPHFMNKNLNNYDPIKSYDIQKNVSNGAFNNRKLRTIHHKRFLKYRRKNKRKSNRLKYPQGHSYQYELFNGNFK